MSRPKKANGSSGVTGSDGELCEQLLLENQLCFALYATARLMVQTYQPYLKPLGLTYPQYIAMLVLWESDGVTVSELGKKLYLDSGTLSPLLKKLELRKLILRERQSHDERSVLLKLTSPGKALKQKAMIVPEKMSCHFKTEVEERERMRTNLKALAHDLLTTTVL